MAILKPLANSKSPNLIDFDREGIIDDLITAIQNDPDWNELWDGELLQNASFMIMNYFAYMAEKGYTQFNKSIRENFLYEAKDPVSVSNILAQRNINLFQNRASQVEVTATIQDAILTDAMLSEDLSGNKILSIVNGLKIIGSNINGGSTVFEAIEIANDGKPNYKDDLKVVIGQSNRISFNFNLIAGTTSREIFLLDEEHEKNFFIDLDATDIIENSIRVYWEYGTPEEIELLETDSFRPTSQFENIDDVQRWGDYFPNGLPTYIIKYDTNGGARIYFGNERFGGGFKNQAGKTLTVFLRSGGGSASNVAPRKIDYLTTIPVNSTTELDIRVTNEFAAEGGADRESLVEAKIFGPLRYESSKSIVGDQDALNILRTLSIKQKVDSPILSEDNTVPILHSHNFIVPNRNFADFVLPTVLESDTVESYNDKFLSSLNDFLNLQGLTDSEVVNEVLTDFFYNIAEDEFNQYVKLRDSNPMNGSLVLKAYKYSGNLADKIEFNLNYLSGIVFNTNEKLPARIYSSLPFQNITSSFAVPSGQNRIIINYDNSGDIEIELATVNYIDPNAFATAFNILIKNALQITNPSYYSPRSSHTWVYYDASNKRLVFESPTKDYGSSIRIRKPTIDSSLDFFGITEGYVLPVGKTGNVFNDDTHYNITSDEIYLSIRRESMSRKYEYNEQEMAAKLIQNPNVKDGPVIEILLKDENEVELDRVREGSNIFIDFYTEENNVLTLKEDYRAKVPTVALTGNTVVNNFNNVGSLVPPANSIINYDKSTFNYAESKLTLAFIDSLGVNNSLPIVPPFIGEFDSTIDNVKLTYKYKINKLNLTEDANNGLWNGSETANILTSGAPVVIPLGFQIKNNTNIRITLLDANGNVVEGTASLVLNSSNIIGNITFLFSSFPTCYADNVTVTKTGSNADFATLTLQNGFNFGTPFASYPSQRKIDKVKIEYITEEEQIENITNVSHPNFFVQDASQAQGPRLNYLLQRNADEISEDVAILIEARTGLTVKESIQINPPLSLTNANISNFIIGPLPGPSGFFKNNASIPDLEFYRITSGVDANKLTLNLKVKDSLSIPNAPVPPYLANPLLATVKKMVIRWERKTYEVITADYKQDIYYPKTEAKMISDILNGAGTKMMSFHHLLRRVEFIPVKIEVNAKLNKGYSPVTVSSIMKQLLLNNYGYFNTNYKHNIGEGFIYSDVNTLINRRDLNAGIDSANLVTPEQTIVDDSFYKNRYYFILPDFILDQLIFAEQQYPQIEGIADLYKITINPIRA